MVPLLAVFYILCFLGVLAWVVYEVIRTRRFMIEEEARYTEYFLNPTLPNGRPRFPIVRRSLSGLGGGELFYDSEKLKSKLKKQGLLP